MKEGASNPQPDPLTQAVREGTRLLRKGAQDLLGEETLIRFLQSEEMTAFTRKIVRSLSEELRMRWVDAIINNLLRRADDPVTQG